ncbi:MAG: acetyl-CoA carboxylase biotin carboxylase subunit [Sphingobacteriia bacterium]|nr:acetyl-CoA carboxylase biotin carboxylase subunit [Sphingobacteriia bacterium]
MSGKKIKKLLVANRGEIALRILRTAKEMGIKTVAVFSAADRHSPHVQYADESIYIGLAPSSESYLNGDNIIQVALDRGADAIHPGYGFLSENAGFARKVKAAGLVLIGPSPEAMETMGSKIAAKQAVKAYDVPMVPGTDEAIGDVEIAEKIALQIGYPILIKASAGGGGKGMRVVNAPNEFIEQMNRATSEALNAFGDGSVFIEKFVGSPRHVEIQVLGDHFGNYLYLFERECSIQRRHQKVIEEAPSSVLTPELRKKMGEAAVNVCRACGYYNAGTVEFLVDENANFYFLEMNTRLQVEHPVTEMITGLDLVREQIRIAEGEPLTISQESLHIHGHAIEVRVYAEDPANQFLPDIGTLSVYERPMGPGVRVDDGFEEGMEIPIYYDPMIAKLIVHARTRQEAIERLIRAIDEYKIKGVKTTLPFCRYVLLHEAFVSGKFDTNFIHKYFTPEVLDASATEKEKIAAAWITAKLSEVSNSKTTAVTTQSHEDSAWRLRGR